MSQPPVYFARSLPRWCMYNKLSLESWSCILLIIWLMPPSLFVMLICDKIATSWDVAFKKAQRTRHVGQDAGEPFGHDTITPQVKNIVFSTTWIQLSTHPLSQKISATYQYPMIAISFSSSLDSCLTSLARNLFFVLSCSSLSSGAAHLSPVEVTARALGSKFACPWSPRTSP